VCQGPSPAQSNHAFPRHDVPTMGENGSLALPRHATPRPAGPCPAEPRRAVMTQRKRTREPCLALPRPAQPFLALQSRAEP